MGLALPDARRLGRGLMPRKKTKPIHDDEPAQCLPVMVETMETLNGPGPCAVCSAPKFEHTPYGGIGHRFLPRDRVFRMVQAAKNSERKRSRV